MDETIHTCYNPGRHKTLMIGRPVRSMERYYSTSLPCKGDAIFKDKAPVVEKWTEEDLSKVEQ